MYNILWDKLIQILLSRTYTMQKSKAWNHDGHSSFVFPLLCVFLFLLFSVIVFLLTPIHL